MVVMHDDENRRRRILIALLALLICTSSAVALGYAYTNTSTATNTENVISGEGLEACLLDSGGAPLRIGGFATENKSWYVSSDWVDGVRTDGDATAYDDVMIGNAFLEIKTDSERISQVKIWYTIEWIKGEGETELVVESYEPIKSYEANGENEVGNGNDFKDNVVTLDLEDDTTLIEVKLYGKVEPELEIFKYVAEYKIVFYVEPVMSD